MSQKGFINIIILIVGIIILAGAAGYFIVSRQTSPPNPISSSTPSPTPTPTPTLSQTKNTVPQQATSSQPKVPVLQSKTSNWNTHEGTGVPLPPYNFIFQYPKDFVESVDIGAVILIPNKYAGAISRTKIPELIIVAFPLDETDGELSTEKQLAKFGTDYSVTGETLKVGKYNAVKLISRSNPDEVAWFFSTYPDKYSMALGGYGNVKATTQIVPLSVSIISSLRSDKSIPVGIDEAIISTIVLPEPFKASP